MQKSALALLVSGALVAAGLAMVVAGTQFVLEGITQGSGAVSQGQDLAIQSEFGPEADSGVYAVQVPGFESGAFYASVAGPSGTELASLEIRQETTEENFVPEGAGTHTLTIRGDGDEAQVFAAMGPVPDAAKRSLGFVSVYVLIVGMAGLAISGIYSVKKRRSV